jgi:bifunctional DNA-binding transcriptional regulator/antitoxin component of YhaV-PrlF toxin-antitoxin module
MDSVTVRVDASGRAVIPRALREALGIPEGGELRMRLENGELRATTRMAALRRMQEKLRALAPAEALADGRGAVEALIADRRAEAARAGVPAGRSLHEDQAAAPEPPRG